MQMLAQKFNETDLGVTGEIHTVVHVDTHAYIDSFLDKNEAQDHIYNFEPHKGMWKIISKAVK